MKTRTGAVVPAVEIVNGGRFTSVLLALVVIALSGVAWAQSDVNLPVPAQPARPERATVPTIAAEVVANDVYIRSLPGTNYYQCGKLYKGDRVEVVKAQQGWSAIVPPPGSYSWIAVQYVSISIQNPALGVVTGNDVVVYAGSDDLEPMYSTSKQDVTLSRGQTVRLLSEEKDEYYKIVPPPGACLWVSSQFLQPIQASPVSLPAEPRTTAEPADQEPASVGDSNLLNAYYEITKRISAERNKPLDQQDYSDIKNKLKTLAENKEAGRAARYAQYTLKQVQRIELARTVGKEIELQSRDLQETNAKIDEARDTRLAQIENKGRFAVVGKLEKSELYSAGETGQVRRYRLLDDSGKTLCYVAPTGAMSGKDLNSYFGHKVGLVGQIQAHTATAGALVEFSDIVRLN
jgi:hypothetical protein